MAIHTLDQKVQQAFSKAASRYDSLTGLQEHVGDRLIQKAHNHVDTGCILDVGMGTGRLANKITHQWPHTTVVGIDFAEGMIRQAVGNFRHLNVIQADAARLPFKEEVFSMIISNLAYQWVENLAYAFAESYRCLRKNGILYFTLFGYHSAEELLVSLRNSLPAREMDNLPIARLPCKDEVARAMHDTGFQRIAIDSEIIKVEFADMLDFVRWLKAIGANALKRRIYIGKGLLHKANEYYQEHFSYNNSVYASFEVIWVHAHKR